MAFLFRLTKVSSKPELGDDTYKVYAYCRAESDKKAFKKFLQMGFGSMMEDDGAYLIDPVDDVVCIEDLEYAEDEIVRLKTLITSIQNLDWSDYE